MAIDATTINTFLDAHGFEIVLVVGMAIGFLILYKKLQPNKAQVDFVRIMNERNVKDEDLNDIGKLDPKWIYRGEEKIGKVIKKDDKHFTYKPTKEEVDTKAGIYGWEADITTIVFRPKSWFLGLYIGEKKILRFKMGEAIIRDRKLIFPSTVGFTALGNEYVTKNSFKELAQVIDAEYSKRLFEANVNVMASKMSHISAETPEMAHELSLKRLEIEKIRAEKQAKVGGLI